MKDIQSQIDTRNVLLNIVGINKFKTPIVFTDEDNSIQNTIATISMGVELSEENKGTHMSRFIELIHEMELINYEKIKEILKDMKEKLNTRKAFIKLEFPYFLLKKSPVTSNSAKMDIDCEIEMSLENESFEINQIVKVPVTTLCPCSKEISEYGAHNQRTEIYLKANVNNWIFFKDLINIAEKNSSCPVYPLLKRPDEKYITEYAYDNPKFVEDVARDCYLDLIENSSINSFYIKVESIESIHNHNAFAEVWHSNN